MNTSHNSSTPKLVGAIVITAVMVIGIYVFILKDIGQSNSELATSTSKISTTRNTTPATTQTTNTTQSPVAAETTTPSTTQDTTASSYKDGTYSTSVSYRVPHGSNSIDVTISVKNGSISSVSTNNDYSDHESGRYISNFESLIENAVSGKTLDDASLNRLGGASLTTDAFNSALSDIISQAHA